MKTRQSNSLATMRRGFTLTELLIVMAILVLLVSMVGPRLLGSKKKADINSVKTQIGMFKSALERYNIDTTRFPSSEQGLAALISAPTPGATDSVEGEFGGNDAAGLETDESVASVGASNWDGPYLKSEKLPRDPWGNSYRYEFPGTHNKLGEPDIWSLGPDSQENTADDIVSWTGDGTAGEGTEESAGQSDAVLAN